MVERFTRRGTDWLLTEINQLDDALKLESLDCEVALREVYANVEFPAEPGLA